MGHLQCDSPAFISTEEGVSPTTIIITSQIFTGFSHGYKRQRFSYDTGRCHKDYLKKKKILLVKGNPPRSGNNTAPVIAMLIPIDSGASLQ